jgi:uncharacterized protein YjbI with pentapeptide repeats
MPRHDWAPTTRFILSTAEEIEMPRREVVDRWCTVDGAARVREIRRRMADGVSLDGLLETTADGLLDLRGLPGGGLFAQGGEITGADLSHSWFSQSHLDGVHWRRCRFDGANLSAAAISGGSVVQSSMRRADLRETLVVGAEWTSVDLTGIKSGHFHSDRATFADVTFPALAKVEFTASTFAGCRFTGRLRDVRFLGRGDTATPALRDVTFLSSDFHYAEFDGMDFENVVFPDDESLIVVPRGFRAVAERASTLSLSRRDQVGKDLRRFLSGEFLRPGLSESAGWAVARRDLTPEVADFAAETLHEAQRHLRAEGVLP